MTEVLTHSKRRDFLNCPRYYYLRHEEHLAPRLSKSGRRRGTIFGDALQAARDAMNAEDPNYTPTTLEALEAAMETIDQAYVEMFQEITSTEESVDLEIERIKIRVMVRAYIDRYGFKARREVELDLPFAHPLTGGFSKTFRLGGKIDGIEVVGPSKGRVIEDKFVGQIQKAMIDRLPLDAQSTEYVAALASRGWAAEVAYRHTLFPGINPKKGKEAPLLTPGGKPSKAKSVPPETLDEFERRLEDDVNVDRPEHYFDQQILVFPAEHMAEYESERWVVGQMILQARQLAKTEGAAAFPKNPSRCWEWGGCEFIPLCTMQQDARDRYVVVRDNPELTERSASGANTEYGPAAA